MAASTIPSSCHVSMKEASTTITTTAIVTKEGLALSPDFLAEHHLQPGTEIIITLPTRHPPVSAEERLRILDELQGMFAHLGGGMAEELQAQRRQDEIRFQNKRW